MGDFSRQIERFAKKFEMRYDVVARMSVKATVDRAQEVMLKPGASDAAQAKAASTQSGSGRMRVKTGFLRASLLGSTHMMPSGQSDNPGGEKYQIGKYVGENLALTLLKWNPHRGEVLFVGWTANYAKYREANDGFMRGAVERWDINVNKAAKKVGKRLA